ncbi:MAG: hypothetical protein HY562_12835 [Ignavibacteriales bacterium]|nr:hypothetical protein [Ignavibacteriales bacterium]
MRRSRLGTPIVALAICINPLFGQRDPDSLLVKGLIPAFPLEQNDMVLVRPAQPNLPFDKVGRKFAILGLESGIFEAWAYPLKLLRNFKLSFYLENSTRPLEPSDIVRSVSAMPEATTLTYLHQSFTVKATFVAAVNEPGAFMLLNVSSVAPLKIVCSFVPALQPMWPAGIGGQYAFWDSKLKSYILSEPTGQNHGFIGSPAATGISYTPAHMLSDFPYEFPIEIKNPANVKDRFIPIVLAGGKGPRDSIKAAYNRLVSNPKSFYEQSREHFSLLEQNTLQIQTPVKEIDLAFKWAKVGYDNLLVDNADLGLGLVAGLGMSGTSGRPGFGWFFGGDAFINSFSINSYGAYGTVKDALKFTQKWQRADGKMAHELSQAAGYIDWFGKYHYGYIHGDTTPFYLAAMYDYCMMTGDTAFVRESWDSIKRAYEWCLTTDANKDGLMDNKKAGLGALEFGALTNIETDVYLAAVWARAAYAMQFLAAVVEQGTFVSKAKSDFMKAQDTFRKKFWDSENKCYSYAFNQKNELVKEIVPWSAVALTWGIGDSAQSVSTLERLSNADMTTDWGVRTISQKSKYYDPLNYNYGTSWPFVTSWVAAAMFKHHQLLQGYNLLLASVRHTFDHQLGAVAEVFSGNNNMPLGEAVAHQGFSSAGVVLPLVRGLLGLEGNALEKKIRFAPQFPGNWDSVVISNFRVGQASFSIAHRRSKERIVVNLRSRNAAGYSFELAPSLPAGAKILSFTVNGKNATGNIFQSKQVIRPSMSLPLDVDNMRFEITFEPTVEILPPLVETKPGDPNVGLKIVSINIEGKKIQAEVEGLTNRRYMLSALNLEKVERIQGASTDGNTIVIKMPPAKSDEFVRQRLVLFTK